MSFGRWVLGAVVGGLGLGAVGAQAAPLPVTAADRPAAVRQVQFFYFDDDVPPPPRYYRYDDRPPAPRWYHDDDRPPRPHGPPPHDFRPPPPTAYYPPPPYGKEAAKDYVKNYRQMQKQIVKEQARAWNEQHGF